MVNVKKLPYLYNGSISLITEEQYPNSSLHRVGSVPLLPFHVLAPHRYLTLVCRLI